MKFCFSFLCLFISNDGYANIKLPRVFGNNMVLQRDQPISIFGWADAGEKISVEFIGQKKTTVTEGNGKWKILLDPVAAGGPFKLKLKGKNTIHLENILIGDVWLCSGQSNMEWIVKNSNNAAREIETARYPMIRHFTVPKTVAAEPKDDLASGEWKVCTPANAANFTAVGYFFAKEIFSKTKIPIGLINTSWGGTMIEAWTSKEAFEHSEEFRPMIAAMPKLDLEAFTKQKREELQQRIKKLQGGAPQPEAMIRLWKEIVYDDSQWPEMKAPKLWELQDFPDFDGVVWYRKTVEISTKDTGKEALLQLAMIDDADETFINGIKVGSTNMYNEKRKYVIPRGILREGKNVIAIRVLDTGGGGGIWGDDGDMKLIIEDRSVSLAGEWHYQVVTNASPVVTFNPNSFPSLVFNGMINPLTSFTIKGVIWYQGEANEYRAFQYRKAFPLMITDWRTRWGLGDFPFYFVQLASYNADDGNSRRGSRWAELRESQAITLSLPNTGMAVTTDIGESKDVHPRNKQDVGRRLAAIALNKNYKLPREYTGPVYQSMKTEDGKVILTFTHTGKGMVVKNNGGLLKGFEIAGEDREFYPATASIKGNSLVVSSKEVEQPVAVRYGWADDAGNCNLYNEEGFPAAPFRTDNWPGITDSVRYRIGH